EVWLDDHHWIIDKLLYVRQHYAYGAQYDYFDNPNLVGWTRLGNEEDRQAMSSTSSAIAVVLSNGWGGTKSMEVGQPNTTFYDITEHISTTVTTDENGWGNFSCKGGSVSVWVENI
ncbi:MAG: alpha-amylase domain-containing protein, partial [Cyanobacteria bacterium J06648_1]